MGFGKKHGKIGSWKTSLVSLKLRFARILSTNNLPHSCISIK
ncbi:unnamed protein product [Callosobruchus maculatus]|uniref:Uncharacterized protein n=1 Tax=Callosobruchus maculatus TaxID=64391 RepID=A0A653CZM9_CALMS|nr:unnamed protein product [Callosobruchus maculatus]